MLDTIMNTIDEVRNKPDFERRYMEFVFAVQDRNIERELRSLVLRNKMRLNSYHYLIEETVKGVIQHGIG